MAIFEEIKRSASDVADKAIKKTNEFSQIAKIKVNIKTAEVKLNGVYEDIGRLFYLSEREGEDNTSLIADAILKADEYRAEIADQKMMLDKLRNVKTCPSCGGELAFASLYCNYCGAKQEMLEPEVEVETEDDTTDAE